MELSSKQRAYLRSLSNDLDVIVHIGKDGIGDNLVKQANDALEARELIKCRVLENSMLTAREACDELSALTRSEQVQVIGTKFVLYRPSHKKDKKDQYMCPQPSFCQKGYYPVQILHRVIKLASTTSLINQINFVIFNGIIVKNYPNKIHSF